MEFNDWCFVESFLLQVSQLL